MDLNELHRKGFLTDRESLASSISFFLMAYPNHIGLRSGLNFLIDEDKLSHHNYKRIYKKIEVDYNDAKLLEQMNNNQTKKGSE